jgi:hypothetical protein
LEHGRVIIDLKILKKGKLLGRGVWRNGSLLNSNTPPARVWGWAFARRESSNIMSGCSLTPRWAWTHPARVLILFPCPALRAMTSTTPSSFKSPTKWTWRRTSEDNLIFEFVLCGTSTRPVPFSRKLEKRIANRLMRNWQVPPSCSGRGWRRRVALCHALTGFKERQSRFIVGQWNVIRLKCTTLVKAHLKETRFYEAGSLDKGTNLFGLATITIYSTFR